MQDIIQSNRSVSYERFGLDEASEDTCILFGMRRRCIDFKWLMLPSWRFLPTFLFLPSKVIMARRGGTKLPRMTAIPK